MSTPSVDCQYVLGNEGATRERADAFFASLQERNAEVKCRYWLVLQAEVTTLDLLPISLAVMGFQRSHALVSCFVHRCLRLFPREERSYTLSTGFAFPQALREVLSLRDT